MEYDLRQLEWAVKDYHETEDLACAVIDQVRDYQRYLINNDVICLYTRPLTNEQMAKIKAKLNAMRKDKLLTEAMELVKLVSETSRVCYLLECSAQNDGGIRTEIMTLLSQMKKAPSARGSSSTCNEAKVATEKIDDFLKDIDKKLNTWSDGLISDLQSSVKTEVKEMLPDITTAAVKEISKNTKFTKPWADLFRKSQDEFRDEAKKAFEKSLSDQLAENQNGILEKVQMKQDILSYEKERRSRNIVIKGIPESTAETPQDRKAHDMEHAKKICGRLPENMILKCIRAGPKKEDSDTNRLVIVTLVSPEAAKGLHKFGSGSKVLVDGKVYWVNPDLTQHERQAEFNARQYRRERMKSDK